MKMFVLAKQKNIIATGIFVVLGLGIALGASTYTNWNRMQKGPENTSATADFGPTANIPQGALSACLSGTVYVDWSAVHDGEVIVATHSLTESKVCIYDYNNTGAGPIRQFVVSESAHSPVVDGEVLYRIKKYSNPAEVEARSLVDGAVLWTKVLPSSSVDSTFDALTFADGKLFASTTYEFVRHRIWAMRPGDGAMLWSRTIEPVFGFSSITTALGALAYGNGKVFLQFSEGSAEGGWMGYQAFDALTGSLVWTSGPYTSGGPIRTTASPLYHNNTLYAAPDAYIALNADTGAQIWNQPVAGTNAVRAMALANNVVSYSEQRGASFVYLGRSAANGALLWTTGSFGGTITQSPIVVTGNNYLYHCGNNTLRAVSSVSGFVAWSRANADYCTTLFAYNGILYSAGRPTSAEQGKLQMIANTLAGSAAINVGVPLCSTDGGVTFIDCAGVQHGAILTHVQATCTSTAGVSEVAFTLDSPSETVYADLAARSVVASTYTLQAPATITESGQWDLTVECRNAIGENMVNAKSWDPGAAPTPGSQRLSIYEGSARFTDGETMEAGPVSGDANIDWIGSDSIYLRPNTSTGASHFSGIAALDRQSLHLSGGVNGKPTLEALGLGQNGVPFLGSAVASTFDGAPFNSGGSAIYGSVSSCGVGKICYAGYFDNAVDTGKGVIVGNNSATQPTLRAEHSAGGVAANLIGVTKINGDLQIDANTLGTCNWVPVSTDICPAGNFLSGMRFTAGSVSEFNCCAL